MWQRAEGNRRRIKFFIRNSTKNSIYKLTTSISWLPCKFPTQKRLNSSSSNSIKMYYSLSIHQYNYFSFTTRAALNDLSVLMLTAFGVEIWLSLIIVLDSKTYQNERPNMNNPARKWHFQHDWPNCLRGLPRNIDNDFSKCIYALSFSFRRLQLSRLSRFLEGTFSKDPRLGDVAGGRKSKIHRRSLIRKFEEIK